MAHRLSCSSACGILPDQGSNPYPLPWQADSQPLRHQGSPILFFYTAGSYQLSILYILVYICQSQSPNSSHHHHSPMPLSPLVSIRLFSTSVSLFLPCKLVHLYHFSRFHIYALMYDICFSLSDLLHSV